MSFDPQAYGPAIAEILALDQNGNRLMPLTIGQCSPEEARPRLSRGKPHEMLPEAAEPEAAWAGLWLYSSCFEEAHAIAQKLPSMEGSFWYAILHRQEPDAGNSAYWFGRVQTHPIFSALNEQAGVIVSQQPGCSFRFSSNWDPFAFVDLCERARRKPGSDIERVALEIQRAEWQLLFDYCARPRPS